MFSLNKHKNKLIGINLVLVLFLTLLTASTISTTLSADVAEASKNTGSLKASYYNEAPYGWAWMSGNNTIDEYGVYRTVPDMYPGDRDRSVSWTDTDGNLWLFGGYGHAESGGAGLLNDLWRFKITSEKWAWMSGSKNKNENGVYGTKGVPSIMKYPGARRDSVSWMDTDGNFWLFGGFSYPESGASGPINDLWRFNITSKEWAWISGLKTTREYGVYGTKGVPSIMNYPGSREDSVSWTDTDGNLWLFGGYGYPDFGSSGSWGYLNDLWKFNIISKEWVWMAGSKDRNENGVYGSRGVPSIMNYPGSRSKSVSWTDTDGNFWLFGGFGYGREGFFGYMNDLWRFNITSMEWTWMSGSRTSGLRGVYGTKGVPDMANYPGGRELSVSWTDGNGNLWLFGGYGYPESGDRGDLNDLWRFNITSMEWTWMSGNKTINHYGVYGTKGVPDRANYPGARYRSVSWTDGNGNLWLFGGDGYNESSGPGGLNDLWRFNIISKEWAWMSGNKTIDENGVYGTTPEMENYPGSRSESVSWTDTDGNLWLFGGGGYAKSGSAGSLNDLWRFDIVSKEWVWMSGNKTINRYGVYGTKGVPDRGNYPGARNTSVSWTDMDGNLWLFGGYGHAESGGSGPINDLWRFNIISKEWAWMSGNKTTGVFGVYGTKGVPDRANYPGSREDSVSWTDTDGNLWLFGGYGHAESGGSGPINDLWRFNITSKEWAWMAGNKTDSQNGIYGTKGVPDGRNYPGARNTSVSWTDTDGNLWLFGGFGYSESNFGWLNDLWEFNITSKEWAWMSGNKTTGVDGVYGTKGVPDRANYPGSREGSVSWTDTDGNLWLFGGYGHAESGSFGYMNDLWEFNIISKEWVWMSGKKTTGEYGVYGTKGVPDRANYPGSREGSVSWTDTDGNLWLFGGYGHAESGSFGYMNDLWRFGPVEKLQLGGQTDDDEDDGKPEDDLLLIVGIILVVSAIVAVSTIIIIKKRIKKSN